MGLHIPRGKFERLDVVLPVQILGGEGGRNIGCTCRNLSARGFRLQVEDANLFPGADVNSTFSFSFQLEPNAPIPGTGKVAWLKRERGEMGKIRLQLGVEFLAVSLQDRERIKGYIKAKIQP